MRGTHIHEITVYGAQLARLKSVFDPRDDRGINRWPTHLSRSSGKRKEEMARDEEEDEDGERPARSFNQTRVLTYTPACISRMGSLLLGPNERTIDPPRRDMRAYRSRTRSLSCPEAVICATSEISESSTPYLIIQIAGVLPV